ncbi:MAG: transporter substrate-binding domain-containing protein [Proteobacteria bacterium]|nr:transporter substrate-binding domain-containing protein [Pseudomonadota bacterium]MBU4129524.1 transporter substrate-binding domain-containing protein [Pseudomonadota bacterium]
MKKPITWIFGMLLILSFYSYSLAEETIRLTTGEWPPFISKDLKHNGFVMRVIKESFAIEGINVEYKFFPWGRAEKLVENGVWDGLALQPESPNYLNSDVVAEDRLVFFHLKNFRFDWSETKDLEKIVIGGVLANTYGENITKMENANKISIDRVPKEYQNFKKMLLGRIDIFPVGLEFGYSILHKKFNDQQIEKITYHPKPLRISYYRLALSKKNERNKRMLQLFNQGLKKLKTSGKYDQYLNESRRGEYHQ